MRNPVKSITRTIRFKDDATIEEIKHFCEVVLNSPDVMADAIRDVLNNGVSRETKLHK